MVCHCLCLLNLIRCQLVNSHVRQSAARFLLKLRYQRETQSSLRAIVLKREEGHRIMTSTTTGCMMSWAMLIPCGLYCYLPIIYSFTSANVLPNITPLSPFSPDSLFRVLLGFYNESRSQYLHYIIFWPVTVPLTQTNPVGWRQGLCLECTKHGVKCLTSR